MSLIEQPKKFDEPTLRMLEHFTLPVWRSGPDAKCDYFNKTWLTFTGRTLDQELGNGWIEGVHAEDRTECLNNYLEAFHARRSFALEYRLRRYDGEYRWVVNCGSAFNDSAGRFAGYLGACYDITQPKQAERVCMVDGVSVDVSERSRTEAALRESEMRFRQIAENISEVFWVWTANKENPQLLYVSPAYETIWGRSCESLRASPQSWKEALHPEDKDWVLTEIAQLDLKSANDITYRILRPDESVRWIRDRIFPVRDANDRVVRFTGIAEDITESKLAADVVRESEEKFRQLLGSNIVGVVFWTLHGEMVNANDLFLRMVGYSRKDLREGNLNWRTLTPPEYASVDEKAIGQMLATGTCAPFEKEYIRKDGRRVSVLIGSAMFDRNTGSSFIMDITARKEGEAALKKVNQQLRILSRQRIQVQEEERRRLSRELHDQIGQLLTAGNLNLQSARRSRSRKAVHRKLDETIGILEQILQKARQISFDIRPPVLDDLGLAPALRWMLDDSATRAGLSSEFFSDPNLRRGDVESETACYRVASEAVSNVVRHARAEKIWVELLNAGNALQLLVRDDGIGFDVADAEKRVTRDHLGLVGMRERATAVGGQFDCKSAPGHGTEVRALFPISSERD